MSMDPSRPIGGFEPPQEVSSEHVEEWIAAVEALPEELAGAVSGLDEEQLDSPYRPGGWSLRQVVHHVADSHMNGYIRLKLALSEEHPTIKPYIQPAWGEFADARTEPPETSLRLLAALHRRWVTLLRSLDPAALTRTYFNPQSGAIARVDQSIGLYAWHGRHHTAQITEHRKAQGWDR